MSFLAEFWYVWLVLYLVTAALPYGMILYRLLNFRSGLDGFARTAGLIVTTLMISSGFGILFLIGVVVHCLEQYASHV
jgi:uncharacterized membrane protein YhaH (DUF805 family)